MNPSFRMAILTFIVVYLVVMVPLMALESRNPILDMATSYGIFEFFAQIVRLILLKDEYFFRSEILVVITTWYHLVKGFFR